MTKITELQPQSVFNYFDQILEIPRASKKEEKILTFLENFALKNNLDFRKDSAGNIVIRKQAAPGFEKLKPVVLQSHVDMVCEKNADVDHDFDNDKITAYIDGDWIKARGTTLGADNGIGVATQMAILADHKLKHGPIECLFTVDEETGLTGARNLEKGMINSKIIINLDSEDDGEIFIGCAGGVDTIAEIPLEFENAPDNYSFYKISLTGLKGGHSGDDINKGYANSNLQLVRFLWNLTNRFRIRLNYFKGGNLRNAIPREAEAIFAIAEEYQIDLEQYKLEFYNTILNEFDVTEPNIAFVSAPLDIKLPVLTEQNQKNILNSIYSCPNGVMAMSKTVAGLVETSTNLASVHFIDNIVKIVTSQRSSVESSKFDISDRIKSNFSLANARISNSDSYPGWTPNPQSEILSIAEKAYENLFRDKVKVKAIHAGLECGLFLKQDPELDMISVGPTLRGVHSPDERMQISTVVKFWKLLLEILVNIPEKQ